MGPSASAPASRTHPSRGFSLATRMSPLVSQHLARPHLLALPRQTLVPTPTARRGPQGHLSSSWSGFLVLTPTLLKQ